MELATSIFACRAAVEGSRETGDRIGFVPTMGALHAGHLSLIEEARRRAECVVVSVFVNPLQFGAGEDFERYPRDLLTDAALAEARRVHVLFAPEVHEIYPADQRVSVSAGEIGREWEGKERPGHFDGVLTVVAKLFNIVRPDVAVFGQKDLQQATLVSAMIRELDFPIEMVVGPTVREKDGLALSSRNRYLAAEERGHATALWRALCAVEELFSAGERSVASLEAAGNAVLRAEPKVEVDYLAVVERHSFRRPDELTVPGAAIGAIRVGKTRLIDNILLG